MAGALLSPRVRGGGALDQGGGSGNIGLEITGTSRVDKLRAGQVCPVGEWRMRRGPVAALSNTHSVGTIRRKTCTKKLKELDREGRCCHRSQGKRASGHELVHRGHLNHWTFSPVRSEGSFEKAVQ